MAEKEPGPLLKLDRATIQELKNIEPDIQRAQKALEALKELGMDTKTIEDKLAWTEKARKTLLDQFS